MQALPQIDGLDADQLMTTVQTLLTQWGLKVLGALALISVGWFAARWVRRVLRKALQRSRMDETLIPFVVSLVHYGLLLFIGVAVLNTVGIQTASIVAVMGAAGLAVGLALQGTLSNFAAGVLLLLFRPFSKGDFIDAGGTSGTVDAIRLFTTTLNTADNVQVIIPNSNVWGQTIRNYAANPTRRVDLVVGVSYDDDIPTAIRVIQGVLSAESRVLADPAPIVAVDALADSSVNIIVRPWCSKDDYWQLRWDLLQRLKTELEAAGCSIPFPQRDVHVYQKS